MIICGTSVLGLIGWVEGLIACFSFCTNGEDMGWPWIEYGWAIGVLSYILVAIICYIHYIGIENMIRKAYHKYSMEDDFKTEIALQENSIYEKECEFSNVKEWCQAHMLEYFQVNLYSDNFYMAYYHNESLIGVIEYHCLEEGGIYLEMLEVCKQFRNLGYGRKIIENIQSNVDYIECIPKDSDVVYFYEKLGFVPCDNQCYIWYKQ